MQTRFLKGKHSLLWSLGLLCGVSLAFTGCTTGNDDDDDDVDPVPIVQIPAEVISSDLKGSGLQASLLNNGELTLKKGNTVILKTRPLANTSKQRHSEIASEVLPGKHGAIAWRNVAIEAPFGVGHIDFHVPEEATKAWNFPSEVSVAQKNETGFTASFKGPQGNATLSIEAAGPGMAKVTIQSPSGNNQISHSLVCDPNERFYGFGSQVWATQHRGQTIPIWVTEQGLGKVTDETPKPPPSVMGKPYDAYIPTPVFLSSKGYGVSLDTTYRSVLELCTSEHPESWRLETWTNQTSYYVFTAESIPDLLKTYAQKIGGLATRMPPDWFFAPMNDAVRGQANVMRVMKKIRENKIPSSVIWTEDWIGIGSQRTGFRLSHDWQYSHFEYPEFKSMTDELHNNGFRFLGYFSPFIPHAEATQGGPSTNQAGQPVTLYPYNQQKWSEAIFGQYYFTKNAEGEPYLMLTPPFALPGGAGLDVTKPEAIAWLQSYLKQAEALGLDGSMTDFGEWVPYEARFADGRLGEAVHNEYPVLWQKAHREFWDKARPDGDYLFYVRSGYTGSQKYAPAFWGGDQNTNWDRLDGIGSVITLGVNLGLSGISFYGHDIGGYSAFEIPGVANTPTTKELFLRWTALGAYTPMMRTHHGSRYGENWSFEGGPNKQNLAEPIPDAETIAVWKKYAQQHISLFPYLKAYAQESLENGMPIMRHMILVYPNDATIQQGIPKDETFQAFAGEKSGKRPYNEMFQYFLGNQLLVAPIIDEGTTSRPVYLPEGTWYHVFTQESLNGPATIMTNAKVDEIPVFAPAGAIIPQLPAGVETLVKSDVPTIVDYTDKADEMLVDVYLGKDGSFKLVDGTMFQLTSRSKPSATTTASINQAKVTGSPGAKSWTLNTEKLSEVLLELTEGGATLASLKISGAPLARRYTIRLTY